MRVELGQAGATLYREPGDKALSHESTTGYHIKQLLNAQGYHFRRMNPSRYGMTDCRVGLWDRKAKIILWHERYQIEAAHKAFNSGRVYFRRVRRESSNASVHRHPADHHHRHLHPRRRV